MAVSYIIEKNNQYLVDCYAIDLYLPAEYMTSAYRGSPYYSVLGTKVKFLGVGNIRFYRNQKEVDNPEGVKVYPFVVPMLLTGEPDEIDVQDVKFSQKGPARKCIVLSYNKGSTFLVNTEAIKNIDAMMMLLSRLEQGKLDFIPPEVAAQAVPDCERMNGISLRIPSEEMEIFVAERYRDPTQPTRKYRFHTGNVQPDQIVSHNMRTDAIQGTTFQAIMHEDINSSLIASVNRRRDGIVDEPSAMERIVRGLDMEEYKKDDYNVELEDLPPKSTKDKK